MIKIRLPELFNETETFRYLNRGKEEILFRVSGNRVRKLFKIENKLILTQLTFENQNIKIDFLQGIPSSHHLKLIENHIVEWFDLNTDLSKIYDGFRPVEILSNLAHTYHGLRIIKVPDLYEALCWSIIGQQINLSFAYQCKRNLVAEAGAYCTYENETFYSFPSPEDVLEISDDTFRRMKFSSQKVKYIRIVSQLFTEKKISKEQLLYMDYQEAKQTLMQIKGIGEWSANYVLMRCLGYKQALPLADVGLQNALKNQLNLANKPGKEELLLITENWKGFESYATFYLWQSLLV